MWAERGEQVLLTQYDGGPVLSLDCVLFESLQCVHAIILLVLDEPGSAKRAGTKALDNLPNHNNRVGEGPGVVITSDGR